MVSPLKIPSLGPFLGLNNKREPFDLRSKDRANVGDYLARAENVDLTDQGSLKRRKGYVHALSGSDCHSLWSNDDTGDSFYADGPLLKRVTSTGGGLSTTTIRSDLPLGRLLAFAHDGIDPVYTDGIGVYRISGGVHRLIVPPLLAVTPNAAAIGGGSVPPGLYQLVCTYADADGREGGATEDLHVELTVTGSIQLTSLPAAFPAGVVALVIYMSPTNGDEIYRAVVLSSPQTTYTIPVIPTLDGRCLQRLLKPLPAGSDIAFVNGRMHVAVGKYLFYSEPFMPGLYRPESGYVPFVNDIALIESTPNSIYIVTDVDTFFVTGDIADATMAPKLPYGGIPRTSGQIKNKESCWWVSTRGIVIGDDAGNVTNRQEDNVVIDPAAAGAALYRELDGMKQLIAGTFAPTTSGAALGSWMEAEVIHKAES